MANSPDDVQSKSARRAPRRRLVRAAKISDHRFRRVLFHFVRDHSASDAARATGLSVNSAHALYRKLRVFFFDVHLFRDFYDGRDPLEVSSDVPLFEQDLIAFHIQRYSNRHGFRSPSTEPHYHFAESCWRYDFHRMMQERPSEAVYGMMERHLLQLIRLCGPIGAPPRNLLAGVRAIMRQTDERIEWFRRNAPGFRSEELRSQLAQGQAISEDP
jgi:hypothetical protein